MKKQIALAVLLLAGSPLFGALTENVESDLSTEQQESDDDQNDAQAPEVAPLCSLLSSSWNLVSVTLQGMQAQANSTLQSMQMRKKVKDAVGGVVREFMEAVEIEGQQDDDEQQSGRRVADAVPMADIEFTEEDKKKDAEIEQLKRQVGELQQQVKDNELAQKLQKEWSNERQ